MADDIAQLEQAIAVLEAQRAVLGDAVVDAALAPMREKLAAQRAQSRPGQERKSVTVLFCDVVGSTHMGQHLDPEDIMGIIDGALRRLTAVIERHGGQVRGYQGDGFMAVFGYPAAREDDAERAVRAGLALLEEAHAYAPQVEAGWGYKGFDIRVGINSGSVVLGGGVDRDTSALGTATNIAARTQSAAPAGAVLITHDTYRYVRGVFDVQAQPPIKVKGRDAPLQTYVVVRAKPRAFRMATRGVEGVETRMIGRDAELRSLQAAFTETVEGGYAHLALVVGEAGIGKSRLLGEFSNWVELRPETVYFLMGRAWPGNQTVPYSVIREALAYRFEILESDPPATALAKFRGGMAGLLEPERADVAGQLVGFDFRDVSPHVAALLGSDSFAPLARTYFVSYLRAVAARQPVLILLEDVHWADDSSLDLLTHLLDDLSDVRLLVVALARPEFFERHTEWNVASTAARPGWSRIDLRPLSAPASRALVDEILQKMPQLPASLRNLIVENAEGNPFYAEELVKMLIDEGVIDIGGREGDAHGEWQVDLARLGQVKVPPTLAGILQARLDGLPGEEKAVLQRAAVVGRLFWDDAVADLAGDALSPEQVTQDLAAAGGHELVFRRDPSRFSGTAEYIFKHALLRDVIYESVLIRLRRKYHAQVAAWLEEHAGARLGEFLRVIAGHYEQAGDGARAADYLRRAGEEALKVSAYRDAREAFEKGLRLLDTPAPAPGGALRGRLLVGLGQALVRQGEYGAAAGQVAAGLPLAQAASDYHVEAAALDALGEIGVRQGDYEKADGYLREALTLAGRHDDRAAMALVTRHLGWAARQQGEYGAAVGWTEQSRSLYVELGDRQGGAAALTLLGLIASDQGDFEAASIYQQQSLELCQAIGDRMCAAHALNNLGIIANARHEYDRALGYYQQYRAVADETGDRWGAAVALANIGETYLEQGQYGPARQTLRDGLGAAWAINDLPGTLYVLADIARLEAETGQAARAAELVALVLRHPASDREIAGIAQPVLDRLRERLGPAELGAALQCGETVELAQVVGEIMAEAT